MSNTAKGTLSIKNPDQFLYVCDGLAFSTNNARNVKKGDVFKLDGTQKCVYIAEADYYNNGIEVTKFN